MAAEQIKTLIVDDEPLARQKLRMFLEDVGGLEIVGECQNGLEAIEAIRGDTPDLVFLDVQMPGADGFEVVKAVGPAEMPAIVFVTAFDRFAVQAFEAHALDYLLKPFSRARLADAVDRAREAVRSRGRGSLEERLAALVAGVGGGGGSPRHPERFAVKTGNEYHFVKSAEVEWVEAADNYVSLHVGRRTYLLRDTMSSMETKLDPARFVRIRASAIVNLDFVEAVQPWSGTEFQFVLRNGTRLLSSRRYRERIRALIR
jgi:two-component system LytT family response regulator